MRRQILVLQLVCWAVMCTFLVSGCSQSHSKQEEAVHKDGKLEEEPVRKNEKSEEKAVQRKEKQESGSAPKDEKIGQKDEKPLEDAGPKFPTEDAAPEAGITEIDWSAYFGGLNGAAVVFDTSNMQFTVYNIGLATARRSPCSTFKIISSLIALERGIIEPENAVRKWSGEVFWNEKWNHDIGFAEAFRESCVWYFRQVIDEIGQEAMQEELDKLAYGNCDISDWEGRRNTNNNNRALTGFWVESSLEISPKEQTEALERIFGENSAYSETARNELRKVMLVEQSQTDMSIYGKTGMGKADGIVVDAWFTGFAEKAEGNAYFCVYLGRTDGKDVSSAVAKEIAIKIVSDYCHN